MDNTVNDDKREPTSLMLLASEKKLFKNYARSKGWSSGKFLRVSARAIIIYTEKKAKSIEEAMNLAVYLDKDMRED
jgi:hypothetical protein